MTQVKGFYFDEQLDRLLKHMEDCYQYLNLKVSQGVGYMRYDCECGWFWWRSQ